MTAKHKRPRVAKGIYRDRFGYAARVVVGSGPSALVSEQRYGHDESLRVIKGWQDSERARLQKLRPQVRRGTFAADVRTYLDGLVDRPALRAEREHQLAWWIAQRDAAGRRLGDRRRYTFTAAELRATLARFSTEPTARGELPAASTIRHYRTALFSLWTALDGKDAPNPLRDVMPPRSPDPEPRWIPYAIIEQIIQAMPDRGLGQRRRTRPTVSKTKARLRVQAYVGIPPAQMMQLRPEHVNWNEPSFLVQGRKKGEGTRTTRLPLTPQGAAALRALFASGASGKYSTSSARQSWRRGIHAVVDALALRDWRAAKALHDSLAGARPYDLRHSFLTESYLAGKDIHATQALATHADPRMTRRYTLAAVDPRLQDVAALLAGRLPTGSITRNVTHSPEAPAKLRDVRPKSAGVKLRQKSKRTA
jgi:integrase